MHSIWQRINTLVTFAGTVLALVCILTTATDWFHHSDPVVNVRLKSVKYLRINNKGNDQAQLALSVDADLRSVFSWNTKQLFVSVQIEYETPKHHVNEVSLWDSIIEQKEKAHIVQPNLKMEYAFIDQGAFLRDRDINVTVLWNVMPKVGALFWQSRTIPIGKLPGSYF